MPVSSFTRVVDLRTLWLQKILDLGEWWKDETGLPLPLGGNVIRKDIPPRVRHDLLEIMRESIEFGLAHRERPSPIRCLMRATWMRAWPANSSECT